MPELLLELGCEELPATAVQRAFEQLGQEVAKRLEEAGVTFGDVQVLGTPRRLVVGIWDVAAQQPNRSVKQRGPGIKAAYDAEQNPTQALLGFCRGQGVGVEQCRVEGDYVWVEKEIIGLPTGELLKEILPDSIRALTFDKSMRWGVSRMRFARPIRWICAVFDGQVVKFNIESVESSNVSRGHRFRAPEDFPVASFGELVSGLRARFVEPDPEERRKKIESGAKSVCSGAPDVSESLVQENIYLTEWPDALECEFAPVFLELPEPVLVTAMAKHERFFPVRGSDQKLTNKFISIRNGGEEEVVRRGNAWVLNARFNDAKFFHDEDKRSKMSDFLERTGCMTFQEKLGSVRQRADRLSALSEAVCHTLSASQSALAKKAGLWAKADLSTGLVGELASLQGIIGAEYARREGFEPEVVAAIATQYDFSQIPASAPVSLSVFVADQIDKLAGYLGQGLSPSGSSDPFGLRRSCTLLIEAEWKSEHSLDLAGLLKRAHEQYKGQGVELSMDKILESTGDIFESRYSVLLPETRYDYIEAALARGVGHDPLDAFGFRQRLALIEELGNDEAFVQTATRPLNIVQAALKKGIAIPEDCHLADLDSEMGIALAKAVVLAENDKNLSVALRSLVAPINAFFDSTMVMVEDENIRSARLSLLQKVSNVLRDGGDWTRIVFDG